ncbi:hypothetical protein G7046_g255 [Stylonectria norvegica]|nr:hypothetical protein G7046_g255 [Stylonectria norvegica]
MLVHIQLSAAGLDGLGAATPQRIFRRRILLHLQLLINRLTAPKKMSFTTDIRTHYDVSKDVEAVSRILQQRPPFSTSVERIGAETSGIDCIVTVIRRIYSVMMIGPKGLHKDFRVMEGERRGDAILIYAWQLFDRDAPADETRKHDDLLKTALIKWLMTNRSVDRGQLHFKTLCMGDSMCDCFWALQEFHLYRPVLRRMNGAEYWHQLYRRPLDIARASFLRLDRTANPTERLQDLVENFNSIERLPDQRLWSRAASPLLIRVLYKPSNNNADEQLRFEDLRTFTFPVAGFRLLGSPPQIVHDSELSRDRYGLIAVVRMRRNDDEHDMVRTYHTNGRNILPDYQPPEFMDDSWSLSSPEGHSFMLFYWLCEDEQLDQAYEEVAKGPLEQSQSQDKTHGLQREHETKTESDLQREHETKTESD